MMKNWSEVHGQWMKHAEDFTLGVVGCVTIRWYLANCQDVEQAHGPSLGPSV